MKIIKMQSNCGEYKKPKGHMDTQLYPECEGTPADRDIVKKTRQKRKKKKKSAQSDRRCLESKGQEITSNVLSAIANKALEGNKLEQKTLVELWDGEKWGSIKSKLETHENTRYAKLWWIDGVNKFMDSLSTAENEVIANENIKLFKNAKKKKPANETPYNPYAVCTKSIGETEGTTERSKWSDDAKKRYDKCIEKVKKQNTNKKKSNRRNNQINKQAQWNDITGKYTKENIEYEESPYGHIATIPAGTPVEPADNLPQGGYWVQAWEGMTEKEKAWQRNYGFHITEEEVAIN